MRTREKTIQSHIVAALRLVGGQVYVIGRPPRRDAVHKGTGQGIGLPDLLVHLPDAPLSRLRGADEQVRAHQLWVEVKAPGGRLSAEQASFRDFCALAGIPHVVGGLDEVYRYLLTRGYLVEHQVPYYRLPQKVSA